MIIRNRSRATLAKIPASAKDLGIVKQPAPITRLNVKIDPTKGDNVFFVDACDEAAVVGAEDAWGMAVQLPKKVQDETINTRRRK